MSRFISLLLFVVPLGPREDHVVVALRLRLRGAPATGEPRQRALFKEEGRSLAGRPCTLAPRLSSSLAPSLTCFVVPSSGRSPESSSSSPLVSVACTIIRVA